MNYLESILAAFKSIGEYKLRAALTLLSIAIGVFAIMGVGTIITSFDRSVTDEIAKLGENTFFISRMPNIRMGGEWRKYRKRKPINYSQLKDLKDEMTVTKNISGFSTSNGFTVRAGKLETDPDVELIGTDENYFGINNVMVIEGRPFVEEDIDFNRKAAVIGNDLVVKIFPHESPIGKKITIKNQSFTVIGVLEERGAILGRSQDNRVVLPITAFLKFYASRWRESLKIAVKAPSQEALVLAMDEAIGLMRTYRNVKPWEENSFEIETNESITNQFSSFMQYISLFGTIFGAVALIAAGVGIMNMMLVSVRERTKEIGIRKAVGARRSWILAQFIIEATALCQLGGLIGVGMGIFGAWVISNFMNFTIIFSEFWFILSLVICTLLGIIFGAYPAWKAAALDPIDALRYE